MALAQQDLQQIGEYVKAHISDWLAEQSLGKPPVVDEIELRPHHKPRPIGYTHPLSITVRPTAQPRSQIIRASAC